MEVQSRGNTVDDVADCLRRVSLHLKIVSVIKSAHASGYPPKLPFLCVM